ncbi:MAG: glycosyltransferase, exosortase A system-associated [Proteobacteria bacterium]|nr:glycosyltransferase, exosortase A system-associated [Pseudomonadota bacterium]
MKILHVLDHSLPHYDGYAFRSWEIIRFQRALGMETVHVTSPKHAGSKGGVEQAEGLEFFRTAMPGGIYTLPILDQVGVVRALKKRVAEIGEITRPRLIHVHSPSLNGLAAIGVARQAGIPILYEVRSFWEDAAVDAGSCTEGDLRYTLTRASETHVVRRVDHVVPICRGIADDLKARGVADSKMTVVQNSVDFARFSTELHYDADLASRYGLKRGHTLGFAGSFFTFEGLAVLIDAMAILRRSNPDYRLLLVGDGAERAELEARAAAAGVSGEVIFTGRVPHADIEKFYGIMDVLVYPRTPMRLTELVTPLKPLEAMAYGKAVLASDVGGHRELMKHEQTALLFQAGSAPALAAAADRLLSDSGLQHALQGRARAHVEQNHNWVNTVKKYVGVYERLVGGRP